ncbi:MAG: DUF6067 family protein [Candidatus Omnitrophica bacterium]|nr:DUF6067 family protein [Candidatus Omnitrophota bacterium]
MRRFLIIFFAEIFLAFSYIKKYEDVRKDEFITFRYPVISIPYIDKKPVIDGCVNKDEWSQFSLLSPLINLQTGKMSQYVGNIYAGYDDENLYFAFQFGRPVFSPDPTAQEDPFSVWADDCIEFFLRTEFGKNWEYSFVGNVKGIYEEGKRTVHTDKKWKIKWDFKARKTYFGWEGEMSIPLKELGIDKVEENKVFEINPANNQKTPLTSQFCWSYLRDWFSHRDFGYLIFGGKIPAVRILKAGEIEYNQTGIIIEILNFTEKEFSLDINISLYKPKFEQLNYFKFFDESSNPLGIQAEVEPEVEAKDIVNTVLNKYEIIKEYKKEIKIKPKECIRVPFIYQEEGKADYLIYYKVKELSRNLILSSAAIPYEKKLPLSLEVNPFILSRNILEVIVDYSKVKNLDESDSVEVLFYDKERIIESKRENIDLKNLRNRIEISTKDCSSGSYKLKCQIKGKEKIKEEIEEIVIIPEKPVWWDNKIGIPEIHDIVPEPWIPIKKKKNGFSVWNREIIFDEITEIKNIKNGDIFMLKRPCKIDIKFSEVIDFEKTKCIEKKNTKIVYEKKFKGKKLKGKILLEAEFDGFMKYTLFIEPEGEIENFIFEIPLDKEIAQYFHIGKIGTPPSYKESKESVKLFKTCGQIPQDGMKLPFVEKIWIGNENMGIEYVCETDQYFSIKDDKNCVEVLNMENEVILRINFVNKKKTIDREIIYQWAIMPTPVKPMNNELLHNLYLVQSGFNVEKTLDKIPDSTFKFIDAIIEGGANAFCHWAWNTPESVWNIDIGAPGYRPTEENEKRKVLFKKLKKYANEKGIRWVIVYALWCIYQDWPDYQNFFKELMLYPPVSTPEGGYFYCPQKVFSDWYIWTLKKTIEEIDIDGVYLDCSAHPRLCTNIGHGCGYIDENGKIHGTYPIFATRELHKRIYFLFHGGLKKNGLVYAHNSSFIYACIESFVDVHHCGEGSTLTRDILIPKFYGYPFGIPVSFTRWNNPVYPETRMNSWRFVLQCDSTIKSHPSMIISKNIFPEYKGFGREYYIKLGYDTKGEVVYKIWQLYKKFDFENSIWIPNWKIEKYAKVEDPDIWICMHLNKGKEAIVVVSSFKDENFDGFIEFNWKEMGFEYPKFKIIDWIIDQEIKPEEKGVKLNVKEKLFRVFYISKD